MTKSCSLRITTMALALLIASIFFAVEPRPLFAQNEGFASYQLLVFCENSSLASATFWIDVTEGGAVGRPLMGLKTVCAGKKCSGGPVKLAQALAQFPASVSSAMRSKVDSYQETLGNEGWFLACLGDDKKPPDDQKRDCREKFLSPIGRSPAKGNCCDSMPETGSLFAGGPTAPVAIIYSEPSTGSGVVGNQPNGTRVVYARTTRINGETWYYVHPPGRQAGWIRGRELLCLRPGTPMPRFDAPVVRYPDGSTPRPTAATVAGARG